MSSLSDARRSGAFPSRPGRVGRHRRIVLAAAVIVAAAAGALAAHDAASARVVQTAEPNFVLLLRFMAVVKGAAALGAADLVWWRLGHPMGARLAAAAVAASALTALGSGVTWGMAHVLLGSALFYGGLAALLAVGYADRAGTGEALAGAYRRLAAQRRIAGAASPVAGSATPAPRNGGRGPGGS